jgi:hypothetical protein
MPTAQTAAYQTVVGTLSPEAVAFFVLFVLSTLGITWWAARRTRTTREFYAAGRSITGFQNGLALAGDYMSAACATSANTPSPTSWLTGSSSGRSAPPPRSARW